MSAIIETELKERELITKLKHFVRTYYKDALFEVTTKGTTSLYINFSDLSKFDPNIAEMLLNNPDSVLKPFKEAMCGCFA